MDAFKLDPCKSLGTRLLKKEWLKDCHMRKDIPWYLDADLICVDMMNAFHRIMEAEYGYLTWRQAIRRFLKVPMFFARNAPGATLALCFDLHEAVPKTKEEEQRRRDDNLPENEEPYPLFQGFALDNTIPINWKNCISDRAGFRREMIAWIAQQFFTEGEFPCHEVLIVGHGVHNKDGKGVMYAPLSNLTGMRKDLENRIGEAENQFAFLYNKLSPKKCGFVSVDSDVFYISMWHQMKNALWVYDPKILETAMSVDECLKTVGGKTRARELVMTSYAAGSDYTSPWGWRITHKPFIDSFMEQKITTPLFKEDGVTPTFKGFEELIYAVATARKKRSRDELREMSVLPSQSFLKDRYKQLCYALQMIDQAVEPFPKFLDPLEYGYIWDEKKQMLLRASRGVPK